MKSNQKRERQILRWMLPDHLVETALQSKVLECEELSGNSLEFSTSLLNENVNWAAWIKVTDMMAKSEKILKGVLAIKIFYYQDHLYVNVVVAPKRGVWFCWWCYDTDDTVEKKLLKLWEFRLV